MTKKISIIIIGILFVVNICFSGNSYIWSDSTDQIYTKNKDDILEDSDINDPLRNGTKSAIKNVGGIAGRGKDFNNREKNQTIFINYISNPINYLLGFLGMLVIILIIKEGIIIITTAGDENKKKEAFINVKNYLLALILIGMSYLLINLVFYFVDKNAKSEDISYNQILIHKT